MLAIDRRTSLVLVRRPEQRFGPGLCDYAPLSVAATVPPASTLSTHRSAAPSIGFFMFAKVAQPPFSIKLSCFQESTSFSCATCYWASGAVRKRLAQMLAASVATACWLEVSMCCAAGLLLTRSAKRRGGQ